MQKNKITYLFLAFFLIISSSVGYSSVVKESTSKECIKNQKNEKKERSKIVRKCIGVITGLGAVYFLNRAFERPLLKIKIDMEDYDSFLGIIFAERYCGVNLGSGVKDLCVGLLCLYCSIQNFKA